MTIIIIVRAYTVWITLLEVIFSVALSVMIFNLSCTSYNYIRCLLVLYLAILAIEMFGETSIIIRATIIMQPLKIIQDIEDRLNGKYSQKTKGLPLSVEGQVDALIKVNLYPTTATCCQWIVCSLPPIRRPLMLTTWVGCMLVGHLSCS